MKNKKNEETKTKHDTSLHIIQTAHQLFMEKGFAGVSTRLIASECGITQPALYHHFPNKVSIYLAVLQTDLGKTEEAIHAIVASQGSVRDALLEVTIYILLNRPKNLGQINSDMKQHMDLEQQLTIRHHWTSAYLTPIEQLLKGTLINERLIEEDSTHLAKLAHVYLGMVHQQLPEMDRLAKVEESDARKRAEFLVNVYLDGIMNNGD
ncbi:TetR/AcrR family transcriptional regulator [Alkalicoccobacillus plakortidis]|uniref:TetR/AcrR family transcriptional regulator n=1 Tax=Alkalicoccobacillus plakortidis TaxID=444060 RepID=A0ABT0XEB5_9BACI|nr:TetR/AcrR family transcriptional regulator [Alkalicoccobacillus plakortidis]MCM2674236.1 TetR/AcrR family transcriptional regulator [Alkalicoccobacillus plakortidis]